MYFFVLRYDTFNYAYGIYMISTYKQNKNGMVEYTKHSLIAHSFTTTPITTIFDDVIWFDIRRTYKTNHTQQ